MTLRERFNNKWMPEPYSQCWLWTAATFWTGYGAIWDNGKRRAHRVSWELYRGPIPDGMNVNHICDTPPCVNPDHLFLGTQEDGIKDKVDKGRQAHSLTGEQVISIRNSKDSQRKIASQHGIPQSQVSRIKSRKIWKHI
jgi:hypothetical protein